MTIFQNWDHPNSNPSMFRLDFRFSKYVNFFNIPISYPFLCDLNQNFRIPFSNEFHIHPFPTSTTKSIFEPGVRIRKPGGQSESFFFKIHSCKLPKIYRFKPFFFFGVRIPSKHTGYFEIPFSETLEPRPRYFKTPEYAQIFFGIRSFESRTRIPLRTLCRWACGWNSCARNP